MSFAHQRKFGPTPKYERVLNYTPPNNNFVIIAGPCSVESETHIQKMAYKVASMGATHLRGGVFRAGTYPNPQGKFGYVDDDLLKAFRKASEQWGLKNIIEILDYTEEQVDRMAKYCDAFQVGARSQQNYTLLRTIGYWGKPVFLKRNVGCTVDEWLGSAEHLLLGGVKELYLIERGTSTLHNDVRWTPCVHTIPSVKSICKIPVIMDASHGTGRRDLVPHLTLAGVAAGAGGILVEVHENPEKSLSDPEQAITPEDFQSLISKVKKIREII